MVGFEGEATHNAVLSSRSKRRTPETPSTAESRGSSLNVRMTTLALWSHLPRYCSPTHSRDRVGDREIDDGESAREIGLKAHSNFNPKRTLALSHPQPHLPRPHPHSSLLTPRPHPHPSPSPFSLTIPPHPSPLPSPSPSPFLLTLHPYPHPHPHLIIHPSEAHHVGQPEADDCWGASPHRVRLVAVL